MENIMAALIGALTGGAFGAFTPVFVSIFETRRTQRRIKRAFAAEIYAIIHATAAINLEQLLIELQRKMDNKENFIVPEIFIEEIEYDPIFRSFLDKIGTLETNDAVAIISFYKRVRLNRFRFSRFQGQKISNKNRKEFKRVLDLLDDGISYVKSAEKLAAQLLS